MSSVFSLLKEMWSEVQRLENNDLDRLSEILQTLRKAIYVKPIPSGSAEALFFMGTLYRELGINHDYEILSLMAYRLRNTAFEPNFTKNVLINLCNACLLQKSFEEAYTYGKMSENYAAIPDDDLLANLAIATAVTKRESEAYRYFLALSEMNLEKAIEVEATLKGKGSIQPTYDLKCDSLFSQLLIVQNQIQNKQKPEIALVRDVVIKLTESPDGPSCWKCWKWLATFYLGMNIPNEMELLENHARIAAASGKAIAFSPSNELFNFPFLMSFCNSLFELNLFEKALNASDRALWVVPNEELRYEVMGFRQTLKKKLQTA